jgi:hypothetical protein
MKPEEQRAACAIFQRLFEKGIPCEFQPGADPPDINFTSPSTASFGSSRSHA